MAIVLNTGCKWNGVWMGYKVIISVFLWILVGKLEFGLSNSDLDKVSLITFIGQFCSAMEIQNEPIEKQISCFPNHGFSIIFYIRQLQIHLKFIREIIESKINSKKSLSAFLWETKVVRYRWSMIQGYKSKLWPKSSPNFLYFLE